MNGLGTMPTPLPDANQPNPLTSISAGYEQARSIVQSVTGMAEQTPWYVWAGIAVLLVLKEKRGNQ
jgi:hypothetical protein